MLTRKASLPGQEGGGRGGSGEGGRGRGERQVFVWNGSGVRREGGKGEGRGVPTREEWWLFTLSHVILKAYWSAVLVPTQQPGVSTDGPATHTGQHSAFHGVWTETAALLFSRTNFQDCCLEDSSM